MSDKFLSTRSSNLTNGTANLYINQMTIENLDASMPVKTNANKSLISQKLEISDVNNLQNELNNAVLNPLITNLNFANYSAFNVNNFSLAKVEGNTPAPIGELKIYASAITNEIHMIDESGNDNIIGGDVFDQSLNTTDSPLFNNLNVTNFINLKSGPISNIEIDGGIGKIDFTYSEDGLPLPLLTLNAFGTSFLNTLNLEIPGSAQISGNVLIGGNYSINFPDELGENVIRIRNQYINPNHDLKFERYVGGVPNEIMTLNVNNVICNKPIISNGKITVPEITVGTVPLPRYTLPTVAGSVGQHLTMGAGTATIWQTPYTFTGGTITGNLTVEGVTTFGVGGTSFQFPNTRGTARQLLVDMLGNGVLTYQSVPTIVEPSFGVVYFNNNLTPTAQPIINTYYDIAGSFLTPGTINTRFTTGGAFGGGLQYTGNIPRVFKADFSGSWYTGGVLAETYEIGLHANGNLVLSGQVSAKVDNSAVYPNCFAGSTLINLGTGDILELKVRCLTATQSVIISTINFNVVAVGV